MKGHEGKTAVVTGAAAGIGRAVCGRLAEEGVDIVGLDLQDASAARREVEAAGRSFVGHVGDVSDPKFVESVAAEVESDGGCDILINNAGIYPVRSFEELTYEEWRRVQSVNLDAMFLLCKALVPGMRTRGWGRIVNLTSNTINVSIQGFSAYVTSKAAVVGLTRALASEVAQDGVTVNSVAPSLVRTPGTVGRPDEDVPMDVSQEQEFRLWADLQAIKRVQEPEDLMGPIAFLTSDESAFVTAQTLYVDGGQVRV